MYVRIYLSIYLFGFFQRKILTVSYSQLRKKSYAEAGAWCYKEDWKVKGRSQTVFLVTSKVHSLHSTALLFGRARNLISRAYVEI